MCLVLAKPAGIKLPKGKELRLAFDENDDGFGLSFQYNGKVRTIKGAMTVADMFALLNQARRAVYPKSLTDVDMVLQWRKAMTGSVCQRFCHPFPVSAKQADLDSLDVMSKVALAHNGVIWDYHDYGGKWSYIPKLGDINDAQEFIKDYLARMGSALFNPAVQALIGEYADSKFALLSSKGINLIGKFEEDKGCWYSNFNHRWSYPTYPASNPDKPKLLNAPRHFDPYVEEYIDNGVAVDCEFSEVIEDRLNVYRCDMCQDPALLLYVPPDCDDSKLCKACFEGLYGRQPSLKEAIY
jgi:hypothetical protein